MGRTQEMIRSLRRLKHMLQRVLRRVTLGKLDTVAKIRDRNPEFAPLRARVCEAGTDNFAVFGTDYRFEGGLSLQQDPDEFVALCLCINESGAHGEYMEIGSASGGTCRFLSDVVGFQSVLSLDDGQHPRAVEQAANLSHVGNLKQFLGDSHSEAARDFLTRNVAKELDVAFIDGDHSFDGVWQDILLSLPFCRKGALMIFHDTRACPPVRKAWLKAIKEGLIRPLAEYEGFTHRRLGISVNSVL